MKNLDLYYARKLEQGHIRKYLSKSKNLVKTENATLQYISGPSQGLKIRGGHVILGGENVPPLVEIGLTDLPKSGCAMAHPAHPGTTGLNMQVLKESIKTQVIKIRRQQI